MGSCFSGPLPYASHAKMWEVDDISNLPLCRINRSGE